jgi:hypothetical protein
MGRKKRTKQSIQEQIKGMSMDDDERVKNPWEADINAAKAETHQHRSELRSML